MLGNSQNLIKHYSWHVLAMKVVLSESWVQQASQEEKSSTMRLKIPLSRPWFALHENLFQTLYTITQSFERKIVPDLTECSNEVLAHFQQAEACIWYVSPVLTSSETFIPRLACHRIQILIDM